MLPLLRALVATLVIGVPGGLALVIAGWSVGAVLGLGVLTWATVSAALILEQTRSSR